MKVFISQPMKGLSDQDILKERKKIISELEVEYGEVEIVDSFFEGAPADAKPLWFLGKSLEMLSTADAAFFADGWQYARGCKFEHECSVEYGIEIIHD